MINLDSVSKKFGTGVFGLSNISFEVTKGEFVFLVGPTGSGKSTIFKLIIRETLPTKGTIVVNSWDVLKLPSNKVPELRKKIGVVFQDLKLLFDRTILENIVLPLEIAGIKTQEALRRGEEVMNRVGISDHKDKFPIQLSGGELQRVAIARALILSPEILLADEPTGNLDDETSWEIVKLLSDINENGTTIIMATHDLEIVKKLDKRVIKLDKGEIVDDKGKPVRKPEEEDEKKENEEVKEESKNEEKPEAEEKEEEKSDVKEEDKEEKHEDKHKHKKVAHKESEKEEKEPDEEKTKEDGEKEDKKGDGDDLIKAIEEQKI